MKRSLYALTALIAAGLTGMACAGDSSEVTADDLAEKSQAVHDFCGNGRCDHGETCSTCSLDCGSCGTGGSGGGSGVCDSTAAPPAHYDHVVIFSFENRTWSNVGLGFSATTMPYLHSLASQCSYFSDWTENESIAEQPDAVHRRDERRE